MKEQMTREQMIRLIASDYGYGEETTQKLTTEILRDVCNSSQPHVYLSSLLALDRTDISLEE